MFKVLLSACAGAILSTAAIAQDLPKNQFKVIGLNRPTPVSIYDEVPFWRKTITEVSKGAITADITPLDQMGIDDKTMLRLLKLGVMDFAGMDISKMAGDDPRFEACDLAGLTLDPDKRAQGLRRLSRRHRPADAEELERQTAGVRRQHAAGVLVQGRRRAGSPASKARRSASSTTRCATSSAASARPRSAWRSPKSCRRSAPAWWIAA